MDRLRNKIIAIFLIIIIISTSVQIILQNNVKATSNRYLYDGNNLDTNKYPGFKEKIDELKRIHNNWNFIIMETGLDWNQTIIAESAFAGSSPISLIQNKSGDWICSSCGSKTFDNGSWYHASEDAIKYYMDARNWLNDNAYILQFLQVGYVETTDENIYNALNGTFLYTMDNARAINSACKEKGANPYYIIARILQEQGTKGSATSKMLSDGVYYYNLFNIGASGNGTSTIVARALAKAKEKGWTTIQKSIEGGIDILFADYIQNKQDTMYLNKFDVESYGGVYSHQYMQNIQAPTSEAMTMYNKIKDSGILNEALTFVIPVFKNMPTTISVSPDTIGELGPKNIRVKVGHSDINVRSSRTTNTNNKIGTIKNSENIVLSVERYGDGWHKVVYEDNGTFKIGYIFFNTDYFEEINDITNCNEELVISGDMVNLRSGPGTSLPIITILSKGQKITRIDNSGRYNIDGVIWDRVRLSDGRQGFVSRVYLEDLKNAEIYQVRADGGLFLRTEPSGYNIRLLADGSYVTIIEKGSDNYINGYQWDKVVTPDGATGYVARKYLVKVDTGDNENNNDNNNNNEVNNDNNNNNENGAENNNNGNSNENTNDIENNTEFKIDENAKIIKIKPKTNIKNLKKILGNDITFTNSNGNAVDNEIIGTGFKVSINSINYTVVKLGDCNGDGNIDIIDMALIKRHLINTSKLQNEFKCAAKLSTNSSDEIDIIDMALMKRYLIGKQEIEF